MLENCGIFRKIIYQLPFDVHINNSDLIMLTIFTIIFHW